MEILKTIILLNITKFMGQTEQNFVKVYIAQMDGRSMKYFIENVGSLDIIDSDKYNKMVEDTKNYLKTN